MILSTNVLFGVQSVYVKGEELTGMYYDYALAAPLMAGVPEKEQADMLILGMGTGTYATQCSRLFSNLSIEGVEIDQGITDLAYEYFHLSREIPVYTYDGRAYLNAVEKQYDVIMVDAYQDITIPFQMSSVEFFTLVKEHLKEGGVMIVNMNMRGSKEGSINEYLMNTIRSVFSQVYTVDVAGSTNRELFASNDPDILAVMERNAAVAENADLAGLMGRIRENLQKCEAGKLVMTDDQAPVELLGMRVIDDLIRDEVTYYKDIYEERGLQGLLEQLQ